MALSHLSSLLNIEKTKVQQEEQHREQPSLLPWESFANVLNVMYSSTNDTLSKQNMLHVLFAQWLKK